MNFFRPISHLYLGFAALLSLGIVISQAQTTSKQTAPNKRPTGQASTTAHPQYSKALVDGGASLFQQNCAFCHGRDAGGGESGPDLTRSKLVKEDVGGDKIGAVVRNGRPEKGMPPFNLSDSQIARLTAFIHTQQSAALTRKGGRKGVDVADLQTGNVEAGKQYFNGAGGCATCHSPTGDLAGVAKRYEGLALEEQMLYPRNAKSKVAVTRADGQATTGTLEYLDEFTLGLIDSSGVYRSWRTTDVQYKVDAPVNAHVELFSKYTDTDIHNLMAYLQTLR
jgi:cytochrome c oxidase cbb3-type subunit III